MEPLSSVEKKASLQVSVISFKQSRYVYYYAIQLTKIYNNTVTQVEKRYSQFYSLNESLK